MSTDLARFADEILVGERWQNYRFPIVSTAYPRWCYVTAVVVDDLHGGMVPTDKELRMVASFHAEYMTRWYNQSYIEHMKRYPFDVDGGANGRYLIKYEHCGWGYRHSSWRGGPTFVPGPLEPPMTLLQVLDREHSFGSEPSKTWEAWKAAHPDVFGVDQS